MGHKCYRKENIKSFVVLNMNGKDKSDREENKLRGTKNYLTKMYIFGCEQDVAGRWFHGHTLRYPEELHKIII